MNKVVGHVRFVLMMILMIAIVIVLYVFLHINQVGTLMINEVSYAGDDWIEIYNPTMNNLSLKGMYLSDDVEDLEKDKIKEDIVVPSGGYVVLYGDDYDGEYGNTNKLNFSVKNGETVYLVDKEGMTIVDSMTVVTKEDGVAIGRYPDGGNEFYVMYTGSPGERNDI